MQTIHRSLAHLLSIAAILALGLTAGPLASHAQSLPPTSEPSGERPPDVMDVLRERGQYSTLVAALERTGIDQGLAMSPSFTLLAPTDSAFAALGVRLSDLKSHEVAEILRNHVIQKALPTRRLQGYSEVQNTRGLSLQVGANARTIGGARLTDPDVPIENGIVHGIDTVITVKTAVNGAATSE